LQKLRLQLIYFQFKRIYSDLQYWLAGIWQNLPNKNGLLQNSIMKRVYGVLAWYWLKKIDKPITIKPCFSISKLFFK
jgi:hypothetical protein